MHLIHRGDEYKGYMVIFSEEFFNLRFENIKVIPGYPLVSKLENAPVLQLDDRLFKILHQLIENIKNELTETYSDSEEIIVSFLKIFFLKLR